MVKPSFVVVDASVNVEDEKKRHFGRHEKKYVLLPYYSQLSIYLDKHFEHIKHGLVASVLVNENRPALRNYIYALKEFVETHGFRFSKSDHIKLIKLLYLVMVKKDQWHDVVHYAARALEKLINKCYFTYKELVLEWEPAYELYYGAAFGKLEDVDGGRIRTATFRLKRFYKPSDSPKIWEKVQVLLAPRYSAKEFCEMALLFLNIRMPTEDHKKYGAGLWFQTMWKMYEVAEMGKKWGDDLPNFFATLIYHNPDFMDWRPLYDTIFTRIIRALGLCIREGKVTVGDGSGSSSLDGFARFVSSTIGGPYCCRKQLEKMMKTIEPFLHPSNEGDHTAQVLSFLQYLIREFLGRYEDERIKKNKRKVSQEFYLKDVDVRSFVNALLQPILYSLYSKDGKSYELPAKLLMMLGTLEPGLVFPRFLENVYPAMFAVCEPHRLTQTLDCMFELVYIIGGDEKQGIERKKMEKDWVAEMEKQRSPDSPLAGFSLQKLSTENKWDLKNNFSTFRFHLFYFLEILIAGIDINDVSKANIAIHNLTLIFYIVPILDYSECVKYHTDLTPDEKSLCLLSTRLPVIAEWALDRMLAVIQCLAITAPKDSSSALGNFKDESTKESEEEKVLKKAIDRCVTALFTNTKYAITAKLSKKVLDFVKTNQFETQLATDMISSLIAQMTYASPNFWLPFAEHVLKNLRELLTVEAKASEDLETKVQWFVSLAGSLLSATNETYIDNKDICFEMISLLLQCKSKVAYINGSIGLWYMLYMLSRIYPENTRYIADRLERPLKDWVPVREWGRMYEMAEAKMAWYVPSEKGKQLVEALLNKFLFPVVESLKDENMDRESLKKALTIINFGFSGGITCFALPPSPEFKSRHSVVPWFKPDSRNPSVLHWDIRPPSGENFCEYLVNILEKVAERLVSSKREHTQVLCTICKILHSIIHSNNADTHQLDTAVGEHGDIYTYMTIPISRKRHIFVLESQAYVAHMRNVVELPSEMFTDFHLRVARIIAKLIINDYSEVRYEALAVFSSLFSEHAIARETIVDDILPTLTNPDSTRDQLKGALSIISQTNWATSSTTPVKTKVWKAIIEMKVVDYPDVIDMYDDLWNDIGKLQKPARKHYECPKLIAFCNEWFKDLPKTGDWTAFKDPKTLESARDARAARRAADKKDQDILVDTLLELFGRKDLLHTRQKLCRAMLWRCQKDKCGLKTIKVLIGKFVDDEEYLRDRSSDELSFWLKKNKPKTIRMNWTCPKKADSIFLKCGLRMDNLPLVYDSQNLPITEDKWNKTVFFSKPHGSYQWPPHISVVVYASKPQINRTPLSDCEKAIVTAFEDEALFEKWIALLLIEKHDSKEVNDNTVWMIKYLLRNFPASDVIYKRVTTTLQELLKSRKRAEQRLAAEIFTGVAKGTKYIGFKKLDQLWQWLAPAIDNLYDHMNADAYSAWQSCITDVLNRDDTRRFWWLVERFLNSMTRPAPTAWHQGIRSYVLLATDWRETETRRRICEIAWKSLPKAVIETQRIGISTSLKHVCTVLEANMNNDLQNLPERFRLESVDVWLGRFERKLDMLTSPPKTASENFLEPQKVQSAQSNEKQDDDNAQFSTPTKNEQPLIYLRTLLEFLLQYYEDCITCLTPGIVSLFPMIIEYANEDETEQNESFKDIDIKNNASVLVHEYMSSLLVTEKFAEPFLDIVIRTFHRTSLWRVRVSVLKFLQVIVFSNIYVLEMNQRTKKVVRLLFEALVDSQMEVRLEASRCMMTLIHCDYIKVDSFLLSRINECSKDKERSSLHGAVLGMGAVVMAHPYSTPPFIVPLLQSLCTFTSHSAELQRAATMALREFRRSHREEWEKTTKIIGSDLVYKIENAIAPIYYA
uniref:BLM10_mid domain-containing protein n=2 Tax=Haemonchus contortus TaxID=6289 RepID=A0A7I4YPD5_HAECO